jgi:MYXO-CTERM domain-containing protein
MTITGGILALATDINGGASNGATSVRNPITFSGGAIATSQLTTAEGGKFSGDITVNSGSILLDDPVGAPGVARNLSLTTETGINGNFVWNPGSTLNVAGSGVLTINRNTGTATVGAGATLVIHPNATVELDGTAEPLSDGVNDVDVVNDSDSTLIIRSAKRMGRITRTGGNGRTIVRTTGALSARAILQRRLDIEGSGSAVIRPTPTPNTASSTSVLNVLNIAGGPSAPTARLDLGNNSMVIDYSGAVGSLVDDTRQLLKAGIDTAGASGLVSSSIDAARRLGYGDNAVLGKTSFAGQTVDASSLLVKFTYAGDANLDGQVDITDLGSLATAWQTGAPWTGGDFDYSGFVDITDLGMLATNWQAGVGSPLRTSLTEALASVGLPSSAVPEPACLALLGLAALTARRRRPIARDV